MHKFFAKKIINNIISFFEIDENHILKVLRFKEGKEIIVNYENCQYLAKIIDLNPLRAEIISKIKNKENDFILNVFIASIKIPSMEIAIKKSVELGVNNFYIFNSQYSQGNIKHNFKRYSTIIQAASKQSNRSNLMSIKQLNDLELNDLLNENDINFLADLNDEQNLDIKPMLNHRIKKIGIIIGPEGGFNNVDLNVLKKHNTYIINLTNTILRSETALIYAISIIDFLMKGNTK